MVSVSKLQVLLVEDREEERFLAERTFTKAGFGQQVHYCFDGDEALDFLFYEGVYAEPNAPPRPSIVFLDLSLPKVDGWEVLKRLKEDYLLKEIPVVIFTTFADDEYIEKTQGLKADAYIQKPLDSEKLNYVMQHLESSCFQILLTPAEDGDE